MLSGIKDVSDELHSFVLVDDDLMCTLPSKWLPLAANEHVLAGAGNELYLLMAIVFVVAE